MHTPFYNTFANHGNERETVDMKASMEPLFQRYGVNIVLSGHVHAYMRSRPIYRGQVMEDGRAPIYMIVGEGGRGHAKNYLNPDTPEPWVAVRDKSVYGFGLLNIMNATTAHWTWNMNAANRSSSDMGEDEDALVFQDDVWFTNQFL